MSKGPPPVGGQPEKPSSVPAVPPPGKLPGRKKITDETSKSPSWESWVPREAIFSEQPVSFKVTRAWQTSKLAGVVLLVLFSIRKLFGWKPDVVQKNQERVDHLQAIGIKGLDEKSLEQLAARVLAGDTEGELAKQKPTNSAEIPSYLTRVANRKSVLLKLKTENAAQEDVGERVGKLDTLIQTTMEEYLGKEPENLNKQFQQMNKPSAQQLFSLYNKSEKAKASLEEKKVAKQPMLEEAIQKKEKELSSLEKSITEKMSERQTEAETKLKGVISEDLKKALEKREEFSTSLSKLESEVKLATDKKTTAETKLEQLNTYQDKLTSLKQARATKLKELIEPETEKYIKDMEAIDKPMLEIKKNITRRKELEEKQKGKSLSSKKKANIQNFWKVLSLEARDWRS